MPGGCGPPRLPAFAPAAGRAPPRAATGGRRAVGAARRCGHRPNLPPCVPAAPRRGGQSAASTAAGGWPRRRGAAEVVAMATPPASGGGGSDGGGGGDGLPWLQRLQAKAAATFEELDDGQQSYVQALYVAFVVSAFVSASATMVRLYKAWGLPPFG